MSPDATTTTESAGSSAAPAPQSAPAPAGTDAGSRLNSLEDAFRSEQALNGTDRAAGRRGDRAGQDSPGASAASSEAASKPGEGMPPAVSRRGAAARISEQQDEIARLVDEREAERHRANELKASVEAQSKARDVRVRAVMARIGDDREFGELSAKRMRGETLSYEQDEKLNGMLDYREHAADLWEIAERAHKQTVLASLGDRADRYGLDKRVAFDAPTADLLDHAVSVTEARVRKESANEIAELKAELKGHRTASAGGTAPTVGGASPSSGALGRMPDDGASAAELFRFALREQQQARPSNGTAQTRR